MIISISAGHCVGLRPVRHKTSFLCHEWREKLTPQKLPEATQTSRFTMILMFPVLSSSVTLVRQAKSFLRFEWLENSIFQKVAKTSHTSCFMVILMPLVHSGSLSRVRRKQLSTLRVTWELDFPERSGENSYLLIFDNFDVFRWSLLGRLTSILRYEWREKTVFRNVSLVSSGSLSRERRKTTFVFTSEMRTELCRKCWSQLIPNVLRWRLCRLYMLQVWVLYDDQQVFFVMSDLRTNFFRKCWRQLIPPVVRWLWCLL